MIYPIKPEFVKLFASHLLGQLIVLCSSLILPMVLLKEWSSETYGLWVLASGAGIFFSYSDFGLSVALNTAVHAVGAQSRGAAVCFIRSVTTKVSNRVFYFFILILISYFFICWYGFYSFESSFVFLACALVFVLQPFVNIMLAVHRWRNKAWLGVFYDQTFRIFELLCALVFFAKLGILFAAAISLILKIIYVSLILLKLSKIFKISDRRINVNFESRFSNLSSNGLGGFLSFLGSNLSIQGLMLISGLFGPSSATLFSTSRTISRMHLQPASVMISTAAPFYNKFFSEHLVDKAKKYIVLLSISLFLNWCFFFLVSIFNLDLIQRYWLHDRVELSPQFMFVMFLASGVSAFNQLFVSVLQAANKYVGAGAFQFFLMLVIFCLGYLVTVTHGIELLPVVWLLGEICLLVVLFFGVKRVVML
ncbi:hypothetical protein PSQ40_06635 [Curvibacter sp. HBC61]|uniref:Polysaccharide biosynthesis protein n=1 Tax=Curvibacter cyanobacteriorum TaxID=3026422 RepID=A0ABT5MW08_9BURK|nr:hypothetical protein [Curvibacter sp. HBC61]MDD0838242.1 hypothetical protein [Curvibacter sp. HBC61]